MKAIGLILAGGLSKRLFPYSQPKPLLKAGTESLLEGALSRLSDFDSTYVVTNQKVAQDFSSYFETKNKKTPSYLLEPEARDTAAAVGFALRELKGEKPDWVAVLSADQYLKDQRAFQAFLKKVEAEIQKFPNALFVSGSPAKTKLKDSHSSFGWILPEKKSRSSKNFSLAVKKFVEKPKGQRLVSLRKAGGLINAGMFFGRYETFVKAYQELYPLVLKSDCDYSKLVKTPIDRAIFENYEEVRVFPFDLQWEDLGTWEMVAKHLGSSDYKSSKTKSSFVWNEDSKIEIHLYGMNNIAVVNSGNKILVMPLSETSKLKDYLQG